METSQLPRVVIVGAGFAGLTAARKLRRAAVHLTVIDRQNHHLFQPLLYQVATAGLAPNEIANPIRAIIGRDENVDVMMGAVTDFSLPSREVILGDRRVPYDYLIIATGVQTSYFGQKEWSRHTVGLKTIDDALRIRREILLAYEKAEVEQDPARRSALLTTVVVGGGPTGVEMAGAIAELAKNIMEPEFRRLQAKESRIILVEAADRLLTMYPPKLSAKALRQLEELGVEVRVGQMVEDIAAGKITFGGETLAAANVIWAAGIEGTSLIDKLKAPQDRGRRIKVNADLTLPGDSRVFVLGDCVSLVDPKGQRVPGVAPAAMQMGGYAAKHIARRVRTGDPELSLPPFIYRDKGSMATIGRARAVAMIGRYQFSGFPAWVLWLFIHLLFLVGFHNKVFVLLDWIYNYLNYRRGARLIVLPEEEKPSTAE